MRVIGDLVGKRFGKLRVTARHGRNFNCACDCGTEIALTRGQLGQKRSCGCQTVKPGDRFGLLTVTTLGWGRTAHCQCDCGNKAIVDTRNLKRSHTRSCGCLKRMPRAKRPLTLREIHKKLWGQGCRPNDMRYDAFRQWALSAGWEFGKSVIVLDRNQAIQPDNLRVV